VTAKPSHNPFRIGEHVSGEFFTDREAEVARIERALRTPSALLVYGPRRMGKSSAIRVAADAARRRRPKAVIVSADLSTVTSLFDASARLLRSLYLETRFLRLRIEDLLGGLSPRVTVRFSASDGTPSFTFGVERRTASDEERRRTFEAVFERMLAIRNRSARPVGVVLDEFQAIHGLGGQPAEWHLRDVMQRYGDLSFVCAGSQESLIRDMIGPKRAFYKAFELLHLGPMDPQHLAAWIDERLRRGLRVDGAVGAAVVRAAGPRTQDVVQLARQLYFRGVAGDQRVRLEDVDAALDDVVRSEEPLIRTIWSQLAANQQDVLRVVALGEEQLFAAEVRDRYGLPAPSSVHKAVTALVARGLLVREGEVTRFDSPFFRRWVQREVAPDVGRPEGAET
jgi:hypothetical protein